MKKMGLIKAIKNYRELGHEEFMKRLKGGVEKVSPLQQTKASFWGHPFIIIGILAGMYITFKSKTYWLTSILFGSLILEVLSLFGTYQKYLLIKKQEDFIIKMLESTKEVTT